LTEGRQAGRQAGRKDGRVLMENKEGEKEGRY
jgi:hypothetical protein